MNNKEIQDLVKLVNKSNITELKIKNGDFEISLRTKDFSKQKKISYETPPIMSVTAPQQSSQPELAPAPAESKPAKVKATAPAPASNLIEIKSPIVGTFYRSSSPDKPAFMKVDDEVKVGDVVCIVEAMKLFNEIESEVTGKIVKVMVEDASPVQYDQVLFLVEPA